MAALARFVNRALPVKQNLNLTLLRRNLSRFNKIQNVPKNYTKYLWIVSGGVAAFVAANVLKADEVQAMKLKLRMEEDKLVKKLTSRERRFIKFASVDYEGQLYMTPQDFLDSVVEGEPRPRLKRRTLTQNDLNKIKDETPSLRKGTKNMFRSLRDKGIVTYTEYLFLLSILTKPTSGFRIAFNMFDTDGNQRVEKNEFLVIQRIFGGSFRDEDIDPALRKILLSLVSSAEQANRLLNKKSRTTKKDELGFMERIFSGVWIGKRRKDQEKTPESDNHTRKHSEDDYIDDDEGLQRHHKVDTTIQVHLFGKKGKDDLNYDGFHKFMDNLQTEVLELEFSEFSKGKPAITEIDFAKILLRYTYLDTEEYDAFLERLLVRVKDEQGVNFNEFRDFCRFLNTLEDFAIAMRMYTLADRAISKDEFSRAVKICTGYSLTKHLIDTVFAIFDENGDGLLSYKEFIAIMKDRLHRGFKVSPGHFLEYNDKFDEPEYAQFSKWRHRICRRLDFYFNAFS